MIKSNLHFQISQFKIYYSRYFNLHFDFIISRWNWFDIKIDDSTGNL